MTLAVGTRLGTYEITGSIGVGGMGEVYRATDTKLGRDVALKTLPTTLANDTDRLARFEREAKLLASLNHAHIAAVYGLDDHDGTIFIAMELVEGETLEETLKSGPLPAADALRFGIQIAEALEAAHAKGVVHRDLKPANVMVASDGVIKVLDFGLAKAFSGDPNEASPGHSPALSLAMTQQGLVLGTAGYMSPEQASGQATDQRADVWSFGVVLYEMLTGLPLFSGESVPHILAAVLQTEPDWSRLPKPLHPQLKGLLERCLEKKPRSRYHSIADIRIELEKIASDPTGARIEETAAPNTTRSAVRIAGGAVAGGLVVALAAFMLRPDPVVAPINRFVHPFAEGQGTRNTGRPAIAISPNGRYFVYNTTNGIFLRTLGELDAQLIPGTEVNLTSPTFSPDGQYLAYFDVAGFEIRRISISGGASVHITDVSTNPHGMSWGEDGNLLIGQPEGILQVSENSGTAELIIPAQDGEQFYGPMLLPDGDSVLFSVADAPDWDNGRIVVQSLSTGERTTVLTGGNDARYLPDKHLVYAFDDTLLAVGFDPDRLTVSGGPVSLVQGIQRGAINTAVAHYGFSGDGTLVYLPGGSGTSQLLTWVDRDGREQIIATGQRDYAWVRLSPDGRRAALEINDGANTDIWVSELDRGTLERITTDAAADRTPIWMPDGERIAFISTRDGETGVFVRNAGGRGDVEKLITLEGMTGIRLFDWAPNGTELVFGYLTNNSEYDFGIVSIDGDEATWRPLLEAPGTQGSPAVSPDGNWFAYNSNESGQFEVYVERYPDGGQRRQISIDSGVSPVWSPDGGTIYYFSQSGDGAMMRVDLEFEPSLSPGLPVSLFTGPYSATNSGRNWDFAPDGERFLLTRPDTITGGAGAGPRVIVIQNWAAEVERLLPMR